MLYIKTMNNSEIILIFILCIFIMNSMCIIGKLLSNLIESSRNDISLPVATARAVPSSNTIVEV